MPKKVLRVKAPKDVTARLMANIKRRQPKNEESGSFDLTRSTDSFVSEVKYFVKTGVGPIDDTTGGYPFGRVVEVYGPEGSAKTALGWQVCYQAKNAGEIYERLEDGTYKKLQTPYEVVCLYFDIEGSMDNNKTMEVNGEKVDAIISACDTVEDFFKIFEETMIALKEISETDKMLYFLVVVVDTVAALATKEELKADWKKDDYPRQAKFFRRGFRRVKDHVNGKNVLLICNNQVGDSFKKAGGRPVAVEPDEGLISPIGRAIKFWARLRIFLWKANPNYRFVKGALSSAGFVAGFFVKKNSQGMKPGVQGRFACLFDGNEKITAGLNNLYSKLEHMCFTKVAERDEKGRISFKFRKFRVPTTTFAKPAEASLEETEETAVRAKNPVCTNRAAFYEFYQEHKADIDALYEKSIDITRHTEGIDVQEVGEDDDEEEVLDEDEDNEG